MSLGTGLAECARRAEARDVLGAVAGKSKELASGVGMGRGEGGLQPRKSPVATKAVIPASSALDLVSYSSSCTFSLEPY